MKPCVDVPDYIWISDSLSPRPGGNRNPKSKVPWTPQLAGLAWRMHENGDSWREINTMVFEETGVRMTDKGICEYLENWYEDQGGTT